MLDHSSKHPQASDMGSLSGRLPSVYANNDSLLQCLNYRGSRKTSRAVKSKKHVENKTFVVANIAFLGLRARLCSTTGFRC